MYDSQHGNDERLRRQLLQRKQETSSAPPSSTNALSVSSPSDLSEKEAEGLGQKIAAGQSVLLPSAHSSTLNASHDGPHSDPPPGFDQQLSSSKGTGISLDASTQQEIGTLMGADLSGVKIHTGSVASEMSESIHAKAFTHGQDIYFKNGNYNPGSANGKELLAHELVHTQQPAGNKIQRWDGDELVKVYVVQPGDTLAGLALRFELSQKEILEMNKQLMRPIIEVAVGETLVLPEKAKYDQVPVKRSTVVLYQPNLPKQATFDDNLALLGELQAEKTVRDRKTEVNESTKRPKFREIRKLGAIGEASEEDKKLYDVARTLMKQYLGDPGLRFADKNPERNPGNKLKETIPTNDQLKLILQNFLSQEELDEEDKDLLARFMKKYVTSETVIEAIFGYEDDKVNPELYTEKMEDPELMSKSDKQRMRANRQSDPEHYKKKRDEFKKEKATIKSEFKQEKKEIRETFSGKEKRKNRRAARREKRDQLEEARYVNKEMSRYVQLDEANTDIIENLEKIEAREELKKKEGPDHIAPDQLDPGLTTPDSALGRFLQKLMNKVSPLAEEAEEDSEEEESSGLELFDAFQIYPVNYKTAYDWQERINEETDVAVRNQLRFAAYLELYGNKPELSDKIFGAHYGAGDQALFEANEKTAEDSFFSSQFNHHYLEGSKLKSPNDVYTSLLKTIGVALLELGYEELHIKAALNYFIKRYKTPLIITGISAGVAALIPTLIQAAQSGNYTPLGMFSNLLPNFGTDLVSNTYRYKGKTYLETLRLTGSHKYDDKGMNTFAPGTGLMETNPAFHYNIGLKYSRIEKEKGELIKKVVFEAILKADILFGNTTGTNNTGGQVAYLMQNLNELSLSDLGEIVSNPGPFLDLFSKYQLDQTPNQSVHDYRLALAWKQQTQDKTISATVQPAISDAYSGSPIFSIYAEGKYKQQFDIGDKTQLIFDANAKALLDTHKKDLFTYGVGGSFTIKRKVRMFKTSAGLYFTVAAEAGGSGDEKFGFESLDATAGLKLPVGDKGQMISIEGWFSIDKTGVDFIAPAGGLRLKANLGW